jgi:hypothetical protein
MGVIQSAELPLTAADLNPVSDMEFFEGDIQLAYGTSIEVQFCT